MAAVDPEESSERRILRLEEALRASEEERHLSLASLERANLELAAERRIFVSGPVVVFKWRNAPGWPVEYASPNVAEVFGFTAEEFIAGAVLYGERILPEDLERVVDEVRIAGEQGAPGFEHKPYRILHRDGGVRWLFDFTQLHRTADGTITHYVGYVIDATERMQAEEEKRRLEARMLHAQKLESLGVLAGGIAHDFNNLLTGILGHASVLRRTLQAESREGRAARAIEEAGLRAADMCRQMLAYSGRGRFSVETLEVDELVREMTHLLELTVPRNVTLQLELAGGLPPVEGDGTQLRQVVMNLITNAAESIGASAGTVVLRTGASGRRPRSDQVWVRVEDSGCGMDAGTKARMFEPFFSTKFAGRGLGLAAVQGIVRGHGGALEVESEPGRGTSVTVRLPVAAGARAAPPPALPPRAVEHAGGTVLVIDDEPCVRELAELVLGEAGFEVLLASDGEQAARLLERHGARVSVVLLDMTMPRKSGLETYQALARARPELPIVLTSGYDEEDAAARFRGASLRGFLQKPFAPEDLVAAIAAARRPA